METAERNLVLHHLHASRERLLASVEGLAPEQRSYRPAEGRWSVSDCVEHIILVERFVLASIERILPKTPEPEKQQEVLGKDQVILELVPSRNRRVKGPEAVMPNGRWPEFESLLQEFEATRGNTVSFTETVDADLRCHFFPHPFLGDFDCYQWLLFLGAHCERHVRQLEEVKSDAGFPRSMAAGQ